MPKKMSSASATALHLDLSRERLRQLCEEGVIERLPGGTLNLDDARRRYIRWLRDRPVRSAKHDALHEARTALIELRTRRLRNELMDVPVALTHIANVVAPLFLELASIPARHHGRDAAGRRQLQGMIDEARNTFCAGVEREIAAVAAAMVKDE
jgi:hypothetical protein